MTKQQELTDFMQDSELLHKLQNYFILSHITKADPGFHVVFRDTTLWFRYKDNELVVSRLNGTTEIAPEPVALEGRLQGGTINELGPWLCEALNISGVSYALSQLDMLGKALERIDGLVPNIRTQIVTLGIGRSQALASTIFLENTDTKASLFLYRECPSLALHTSSPVILPVSSMSDNRLRRYFRVPELANGKEAKGIDKPGSEEEPTLNKEDVAVSRFFPIILSKGLENYEDPKLLELRDRYLAGEKIPHICTKKECNNVRYKLSCYRRDGKTRDINDGVHMDWFEGYTVNALADKYRISKPYIRKILRPLLRAVKERNPNTFNAADYNECRQELLQHLQDNYK